MPLLVGDADPQEVAEVLRRLWGGPETLIVVSSDLSHFHDYDTARRRDAATAAAIERGDWAGLGPGDACGFLAIAGLLVEGRRRGLAARRLALRNSGDTAGARASGWWATGPGRSKRPHASPGHGHGFSAPDALRRGGGGTRRSARSAAHEPWSTRPSGTDRTLWDTLSPCQPSPVAWSKVSLCVLSVVRG